jgi:tripartite-type tricarboxylate transporter receptor subunit TctC
MIRRRMIILLPAMLVAAHAAAAEDWPARPVTMVVPFAAGGPTDAVGRVVAQALGEALGQQVVVENVGGAGGMTGASRVAHAAPDGYTILFGGVSSQVYNQLLYKKPQYNSRTDFTPVALLTEQPSVLITRKDLPVGTLAEFARYIKTNRSATFGSAGVGSSTHMGCVLLNLAIGVDVTHVPYRGAAPAMQDLIGGRIDYMCDIVADAVPHVRAGDVKQIAMLARSRSSILPELATADEQGLSGFEASSWYGLFLPKDAPGMIVRKLNQATVSATETPSLRERLRGLGVEVVAADRRSADYLARFIGEEFVRWSAPVKASGITVN